MGAKDLAGRFFRIGCRQRLLIVLGTFFLFFTFLFCLSLSARAAEAITPGDVNLDGTVTAEDARLTLRIAVELDAPESEAAQRCADADHNKAVTAEDARLVLRRAVELEDLNRFHLFKQGETVAPTAFQQGYTNYVCTVCGYTEQRDLTPAVPPPLSGDQEEKVAAVFKKYGAVGAEVAVINNGQVSAVYAYGAAEKSPYRAVNADTKYRVASLSKMVTFLVFMALQDRGLVNENADISTYFGYRCRNPHYPNVVITPSMLMSHTASFVDVRGTKLNDGDLATESFYLNIKPGTQYEYSNLGSCLVACICERATGRYLNDLAKEYLFTPLGIDAAFVASEIEDQTNIGVLYGEDGGLTVAQQRRIVSAPPGTSLHLGRGNLTVSAKDYAKIVAMLLSDGKNSAGETVLSEKAIKAIRQKRAETPLYGVAYGSQIETTVLNGKTVYVHTGSAWGMFSTYMYSLEDRCGVVVLTSGCERNLEPKSEVYYVCLETIRAVYPKK